MFEEIKAAAARLKGVANRTPIMTSKTLNQLLGADVFLKCENYQRMGAFKFRGAYNAISQLTDDEKRRGSSLIHPETMPRRWPWWAACWGWPPPLSCPTNAPLTKKQATKGIRGHCDRIQSGKGKPG